MDKGAFPDNNYETGVLFYFRASTAPDSLIFTYSWEKER